MNKNAWRNNKKSIGGYLLQHLVHLQYLRLDEYIE